ncbi:type 1 glutamine amidotransferase domain-containing protein [Stenotrophomonas maltophilia]|uniref:Type 1 glutamine amidotransferase domain-containing protein n=1 Tax=Stenotrophomonas maltophilia TaxID=40324 RepID=A0A431URB9_STEMA|nr:type 1 glutamine amidotransferase domain-containing protein [Stenotrophomonas maltophilia]RTQ91968.1 type 1 glutamine amidotransferase domain-containing protein [Stenotrophomonas maltophilia]
MNRFRSPLLSGLLAVLLLPAMAPSSAFAAPSRVLLVVSSEGRDQGKTRPGFEMDEFAQAWLILKQNGFDIDVASPRGGAVEADKYNPTEAFNAAVLADSQAMGKLAATLPTAQLRAGDYQGVLVIGGKGAMFDLPADKALHATIAGIWQQGGLVAAVCHGPAALAGVRLPNGRAMVEGRAMTGFTEEEEALFGKRWAKEFAFQLEPRMRELGARWQEAPLMMPKVVVDGRLLTGQNPFSTAALADAFVRASGRVPLARQAWRDERSMALVEQHLQQRDGQAAQILAQRPSDHHVELIGMLGFYQLKAAKNATATADALSIMQLASPHMDEPRLQVAMAEAHWRLGRTDLARSQVLAVLEKQPGLDEANALLARMQP